MGGVDEESESASGPQEGNVLVGDAARNAESVGRPQVEPLPHAVEAGELLPQAVQVLVVGQPHRAVDQHPPVRPVQEAHPRGGGYPPPGLGRCALVHAAPLVADGPSVLVEDVERPRRAVHPDPQEVGGHLQPVVGFRDQERHRLPLRPRQQVAARRPQLTGSHPHPEHSVLDEVEGDGDGRPGVGRGVQQHSGGGALEVMPACQTFVTWCVHRLLRSPRP